MSRYVPQLREMRPNAHCRVCDRNPKSPEDHFVSFYSHRNKGQFIHICPGCCELLDDLAAPAQHTNEPD